MPGRVASPSVDVRQERERREHVAPAFRWIVCARSVQLALLSTLPALRSASTSLLIVGTDTPNFLAICG